MCLITAGRTAPTACTGLQAGMYNDHLWFFNQSELAVSAITNGVFTTLTMDATKTSFRVDIEKGSGKVHSEFVPAALGGGTYTHTYSCRMASVSSADKNWANSVTNWKGSIIGRTKSGTFPALGLQGVHDPMTVSVSTWDTDEEELGLTLEFTCTGNSAHPPDFFITSETASIAALVATE